MGREPDAVEQRHGLGVGLGAAAAQHLLLAELDRLPTTRRSGNSSKCWKTIPTLARSWGRFVLASPTFTPSFSLVTSPVETVF